VATGPCGVSRAGHSGSRLLDAVAILFGFGALWAPTGGTDWREAARPIPHPGLQLSGRGCVPQGGGGCPRPAKGCLRIATVVEASTPRRPPEIWLSGHVAPAKSGGGASPCRHC